MLVEYPADVGIDIKERGDILNPNIKTEEKNPDDSTEENSDQEDSETIPNIGFG